MVGGEGEGAEVGPALRVFGGVDGPDVELVASVVDGLEVAGVDVGVGVDGDAVGSDAVEGVEDFLGSGFEGIAFGTADDGGEPHGFEGGALGFDFFDDAGGEGDDDELVGVDAGVVDHFEEVADDAGGAFDFDVEFFAGGDGGEHVGEGGNSGIGEVGGFPGADVERLQVGELGFADGEFFMGVGGCIVVVDTDNLIVAGEVEVAFDGVGSLLPGEVKGGEGVFGGVAGGSAVGDDEGAGVRNSLGDRHERGEEGE